MALCAVAVMLGQDGDGPGKSTSGARATTDAASLKWYYAKLFPLDLFTRWLSYGDLSYLGRREVSMTLLGDIYIRWKSFTSSEALVATLKAQTPVKLDIGAVYNFPPKDKGAVPTPLVAQEKELVFDIDMTDYQDVMGDLAGGSAVEECDRNWQYMAAAVKVIDAALREDFGFTKILWVYSGRRGIHCWVADQRARRMSNEQRIAVVDFLHVRFEGKENAGRKQAEVSQPLHPSLARAKKVACESTFREFVLGQQGMLNSPERTQAMLSIIPSAAIRATLSDKLLDGGVAEAAAPLEKWDRIEKEITKAGKKEAYVRGTADYIMFKYTYPRLDINVSKDIGHLLKAPFCVHPKTGRVCVPFRASEVDSFLPGKHAPVLGELLTEIENAGSATTEMNKAVSVFKEFVVAIELESRASLKASKLEAIDRKNAVEMMTD